MARIAAVRAAGLIGMDEVRIGELSTAVGLLGDSLSRQVGNGHLVVRTLRRSDVGGVEVVLVHGRSRRTDRADSDPRTGHAPCLVLDLKPVVRMATWHDSYALPGRGTVLAMQFWPRGVYPTASTAAGLTRPMAGETLSGDQVGVVLHEDGPMLIAADGLGHGHKAAAAARAAVDVFRISTIRHPADLLDEIHRSIADTSGAAVAIAKVESAAGVVRFAGLGNVTAAIVTASEAPMDIGPDVDVLGAVESHTGTARRIGMISHPGIAGRQRGRVRESCYPIGTDDLIVMHSDGLTDRWDLGAYPGLARHEPLVVAATLLRDAAVRPDDACVLVARCG